MAFRAAGPRWMGWAAGNYGGQMGTKLRDDRPEKN